MPSSVVIPKLTIVELTNPREPNGQEVVFGIVVSGREPNGSYAIEVVDPKSGKTNLIQAAGRDLRVKHDSLASEWPHWGQFASRALAACAPVGADNSI